MLDFEKVPYDYYTEAMCLWCILLDNNVMYENRLSENDFYTQENKKYFSSILELREKKRYIDCVTLNAILEDWHDIDILYDMCNKVIVPSKFVEYQEIVLLKSRQRKLLNAGKKIQQLVYSDVSPEEISVTWRSLLDIDIEKEKKLYFFDTVDWYGKWSKCIWITWLKKLDATIDWLHPNRLYVIWAWSHVGKTFVACHIAKELAKEQDKKCMYFTMEMTWWEIADRLIANSMKISYYDRLNKKAEDIKDLDIEIITKLQSNVFIESWSFNIEDIIANIRRWYYKDNISFFIVDHLWLIKFKWKDTRNNEIWERTSKLKQLRLEIPICIILLSQLNRWDKKMKNIKPTMDNLRDSWNIEQDADCVILLHRDVDDDWIMSQYMEIIVAKNRIKWEKWVSEVLIHWSTFCILDIDKSQQKNKQIQNQDFNS